MSNLVKFVAVVIVLGTVAFILALAIGTAALNAPSSHVDEAEVHH